MGDYIDKLFLAEATMESKEAKGFGEISF